MQILHKRSLKHNSIKAYEARINVIKNHLPNVDINTITPKDIHGFIMGYDKPTMAKLIRFTISLSILNCSLNEILNKIPKKSDYICNISVYLLRNIFSSLLPDCDNKPTFHEIKSLSARLYEEEKGAEFASKLLGHKSMTMTSKYLDSRNNDYIEL